MVSTLAPNWRLYVEIVRNLNEIVNYFIERFVDFSNRRKQSCPLKCRENVVFSLSLPLALSLSREESKYRELAVRALSLAVSTIMDVNSCVCLTS